MTEHIVHPFEPFFRADSKILIVGSLPSVKSRENGFYYGHPQNRFWKMLAMIFSEETPLSIEEKKRFLEKHKIAVYDSISECTICGSSDSSISNVVPSDIEKIVSACKNIRARNSHFRKPGTVSATTNRSKNRLDSACFIC